MKQFYPYLLTSLGIALLLTFISPARSYAQCPDGSPQGATAWDQTIPVDVGFTDVDVSFPKFNPANGMVTCVKLCMTITGIIDSAWVENYNASGSQTANFYYIRTDQLTGPGLGSPLSNYVSQNLFGPIPLAPSNGVVGSGPDYYKVIHDTILNKVSVCRQISDSTTISQFYGYDSVSYHYEINAFTNITCTGNNSANYLSGSASGNLKLTYCTCPAIVLPINVHSFEVFKLLPNKAKLQWSGFDESTTGYHYEAEVSRNGRNFTTIGSFEKNTGGDAPYITNYTATSGTGVYYFRIRQVYSNGYVRYSNIRQVLLENSGGPKFSIYPNPSTGIVGIKFDNILGGPYSLKIFNAQGQVVTSKEITLSSSAYQQIAKLETGVYWIRLTDRITHESSVNQLLIK